MTLSIISLDIKDCYAECNELFTIMLIVDMLSVIMVSVIMLRVVMLKVIMVSVVMLSFAMLSFIMLNIIMLNVVTPSLIFVSKANGALSKGGPSGMLLYLLAQCLTGKC
jgi:hypothetical protein